MSTISGIIFDDVNENGTYDGGDTGIASVYVALRQPDGTCINVQSIGDGTYSFTGLTQTGNYTLYETVGSPNACPPTSFTQPTGYTSSSTQRQITINIPNATTTSANNNFGHSNPVTTPAYATLGIQVAGSPNSSYYRINLLSGVTTDVGVMSPTGFYNAIGYNVVDSNIYGFNRSTFKVVRLNNDTTVATLATVANLPANQFNVGDVDLSGRLYLYVGTDTTYYVVDVNPNSATFLYLLNPAAGYTITGSGRPIAALTIADWAFSPIDNNLYGVDGVAGVVYRINPVSSATTGLTTSGLAAGTSYGAIFFDSKGRLYALDNATGSIYKIVISGGNATATFFAQGVPASANDGARSPYAEMPEAVARGVKF